MVFLYYFGAVGQFLHAVAKRINEYDPVVEGAILLEEYLPNSLNEQSRPGDKQGSESGLGLIIQTKKELVGETLPCKYEILRVSPDDVR